MNARTRGIITFVVMVVFAAVVCGWIPFTLMPANGVAVALPVITVPGEVIPGLEGAFFGIDITNSLIGTFVTDLILVLFVFLAWRASKGWTQEVPSRFQAWVEVFVETFYNFCYNIGGERLKTAPMLWPIVATIFIFLLTANWMKLLPGVETIGLMHCAHPGTAGYPRIEGSVPNTYTLYVDTAFNAGEGATLETEHACHNYLTGHTAEHSTDDATHSEESHSEEGSTSEEGSASTIVLTQDTHSSEAATEEATDHSADAAHGTEDASQEAAQELEASEDASAEAAAAEEAALLAETQVVYPEAQFALTAEEIEKGVEPYVFAVTPFLRGPATDLSLAFALALISVVLVQAYGVYALGPAYFEKFINVSALGNLGKKPLGLIDFVVGLIEIISEIGKIVSLAFRLFGNLFAGGVVLMVMAFLVATIIPGVFMGLEIIIGLAQAMVFGVLTLVFSVQAMEAHHGDDHDDHH